MPEEEFPQKAISAARDMVEGQESDIVDSSSTPESDSKQEQFARVGTLIKDLSKRFNYYLENAVTDDGVDLGMDRQTHLLQELAEAQQRLNAGELVQTTEFNLFAGLQARHEDRPAFAENHELLENIYNSLSQIAGRGRKSYYDLENRSRELSQQSMWITPKAPLRFKLGDEVALKSTSGRVSGLLMRVGPNIFTSFYIPNIGHPGELIPENTKVVISVVPDALQSQPVHR